jgi:hypothetical protein
MQEVFQCKETSDHSLKEEQERIEDGLSQLRGCFIENEIDANLRKEGRIPNTVKTGSAPAGGPACP